MINETIDHDTLDQNGQNHDTTRPGGAQLCATGSILGALLASSCCIAPLLLVMFGIGGAWIGNLTVLAPYKPYFLTVTTIFLAVSFWIVYWRPAKACTEPNDCGRPMAGRISKSVLWVATLLVLLSATVDLWAPWFY